MGGINSKVVVETARSSPSNSRRTSKKMSTWSLSNSSNRSAVNLRREDELIVKIMMPLYYTSDPVRFQDVYDAKLSWDKIMKNTSPSFEVLRSGLPYANSREWFEVAFYERLFNVHPFSKKMFRDPATQGKFLVAIFSFIFTVMDDEDQFVDRLHDLAESHCQRGVKSSEYAIIGEVMFWTLKLCLGSAYDSKTHFAWVKIFSKMLGIIVPLSVSYELKNNTAQLERVRNYANQNTPKSVSPRLNKEAESACPFISAAASKSKILKPKFTVVQVKEVIPAGSLSPTIALSQGSQYAVCRN